MITREEEAFTRRALRYFDLPAVSFAETTATPDIAIDVAARPPVVLLGKGFEASGARARRQKIVHELLHAAGHDHSPAERARGYYSDPARDAYSRAVLADLEAGAAHYNPRGEPTMVTAYQKHVKATMSKLAPKTKAEAVRAMKEAGRTWRKKGRRANDHSLIKANPTPTTRNPVPVKRNPVKRNPAPPVYSARNNPIEPCPACGGLLRNPGGQFGCPFCGTVLEG